MSRVIVSRVTGCWAAVLCAALLPAQQPRAFVVEAIPGAAAVGVGVLWEHRGPAVVHDAGQAAVLAECRLQRARLRAPHVVASLHVDGDVACIVGTAAAAEAQEAGEFAAALLDDGLAMGDDAIALATARAALQADDTGFLIPAGVLEARALAALQGRQQPAGDSRAMLEMTPAAVRSLLRERVGTAGMARGAVTPALAEALAKLPLADCPAVLGQPAAVPAPPGGCIEEVHSRVDEPFVMAAFRVPREGLAAFAVGLEVAKQRAARRFKLRGSEMRARTPVVAWSWLAGDGVVRFHRRGEEPRKLLPGEVAADAAAELAVTTAELEAFLQDLRQNAPGAAEVSNACTHAVVELGLAEPTLANSDPAVLAGRLRASLLARRRGIEAAAIAAVTPAMVQQALQSTLDPAAACWHALMPAPRPGWGWRHR